MPAAPEPFPRPTPTFVGRQRELRRSCELLSRETLSLIYGIAGVGKSEFVYKLVERVRDSEPWSRARPVQIELREPTRAEHLVTLIASAAGIPQSPPPGQTTADARIADDLAHLGSALEREPHIVFVDNAHHLDARDAARVLGYLARHVRLSRILVASRLELPLSPEAPMPAVTRLGPLDKRATGDLVAQVAELLGIEAPDDSDVYRRSRGSPFYVLRELATAGGEDAAREGSLSGALRELPDSARQTLMIAAAAGTALPEGEVDPDDVALLKRWFLIDRDRAGVGVHDIVREELLSIASGAEHAAAHHSAASILSGSTRAPDRLQAVSCYLAAGDPDSARAVVLDSYRLIARAGLDNLLLEPLERLRSHAGGGGELELLTAHILVRRSLIAEAREVLDAVPDSRRDEFRYLVLAGEAAQRGGQLDRSAACYQQASRRAARDTERFQAALQQAQVYALGGDFERAQAILDTALDHLEAPTARHRGRLCWTRASCWILEGCFERAAQAAREGRAAMSGHGLYDLIVRIALIETIARVESDDVAGASELIRDVVDRAPGLRDQAAALYRGVVSLGRGELRRAVIELSAAVDWYSANGDHVNACIAGYMLARALLRQGEAERSREVLTSAHQRALDAGVTNFVGLARSLQGSVALELDGPDAAIAIANDPGIDPERLAGETRVRLHIVLARADAAAGRHDSARSELDAARAALGPEARASRMRTDVEAAYCELLAGREADALTLARPAVQYYEDRGLRYDQARAALICIAAHLACGELAVAEALLDAVRGLIDEHGYGLLRYRAEFLRAAVSARRGDSETSAAILTAMLRERGAHRDDLRGRLLRAGLSGTDAAGLSGTDAAALPGIAGLIQRLGFAADTALVIRDRRGCRRGTDRDVADQEQKRDLVVDLDRGHITAGGGQRRVTGRSVMCQLLATLIEAEGECVEAETLYLSVWGGGEYHPLRHRNKLYVTLNRLRKLLAQLLGEREAVERLPAGWRLHPDIDACTIRRQAH